MLVLAVPAMPLAMPLTMPLTMLLAMPVARAVVLPRAQIEHVAQRRPACPPQTEHLHRRPPPGSIRRAALLGVAPTARRGGTWRGDRPRSSARRRRGGGNHGGTPGGSRASARVVAVAVVVFTFRVDVCPAGPLWTHPAGVDEAEEEVEHVAVVLGEAGDRCGRRGVLGLVEAHPRARVRREDVVHLAKVHLARAQRERARGERDRPVEKDPAEVDEEVDVLWLGGRVVRVGAGGVGAGREGRVEGALLALERAVGRLSDEEGEQPEEGEHGPGLVRRLEDVDDVHAQRLGEVVGVHE